MQKSKKYAIACPTSMGVRITPENRQATHISDRYYLQATSAESNVLNIASSLGYECLALTKFVAGSPIAQFIKSRLRQRNISYEGVDVPQGGPWGYRHQFNIADSGFGLRAPIVWNDRTGEVGLTLSIDEFDIPRICSLVKTRISRLDELPAMVDFLAETLPYDTDMYTH